MVRETDTTGRDVVVPDWQYGGINAPITQEPCCVRGFVVQQRRSNDRIGEWRSQGRDVFAYFNNDGYGHAVRNALRLRQLVGS